MLIIFILLVIIIIIYYIYNRYLIINEDNVYIKSNIDNKLYLVRNVEDKQNASNLLARIKQNIMNIATYLYENIDKYKKYNVSINQLYNKIQNSVITESSSNSVYTSYSVNKGEELVFCLRSKDNKGQLHDINLLMYVVLHEMAHVGCPEYGHTDLFKDIFAFYTQIAIELKLYTKIDFGSTPYEYCGMMITDSII